MEEEEAADSVARRRLTNVTASLIFMYSKANKFKNKCFTVNWVGASRYCGLMNANFYVGCILPWFSGPTHRVRSWTYARSHYEASTDGPRPLFLGTCDFKPQLLSLPRESESPAFNASVCGRQIGQGVCSFDGDHKQWPVWGLQNHYIYINLWVLVWGVIEMAFCVYYRLAPDLRKRIISIMSKCNSQVSRSSDWRTWCSLKGHFQREIALVQCKNPSFLMQWKNVRISYYIALSFQFMNLCMWLCC